METQDENRKLISNAINKIKKESINKLLYHPKLNNITEALSLNNIMLVSGDKCKDYNMDVQLWESIVQESKNNGVHGY